MKPLNIKHIDNIHIVEIFPNDSITIQISHQLISIVPNQKFGEIYFSIRDLYDTNVYTIFFRTIIRYPVPDFPADSSGCFGVRL